MSRGPGKRSMFKVEANAGLLVRLVLLASWMTSMPNYPKPIKQDPI